MTSDEPITVVHTELSPEFNQFILGTGDVLSASVQLNAEEAAPTALAKSTANAVLFTLAHGVSRARITVEIWPTQPSRAPSSYVDFHETSITATDSELNITSITPSPDDRVIQLPQPKKFAMHAFLLSRELQNDPDLDIEVNIEHWLIRLW